MRTHLQDTWAQLFEKVADVWGRQIRYGGSPDEPTAIGPTGMTRVDTVTQLLDFSTVIANLEEIRAKVEQRGSVRTSIMRRRRGVPKEEFARIEAAVRDHDELKSVAEELEAKVMERMRYLLSLFQGDE